MEILKYVILSVCFTLPSLVSAGENSGVINDLRINRYTHFTVVVEIEKNRPACATSPYWAVDIESASGKALLSALLAAHAQNKKIHVWGNDTCNGTSGMEFVRQIRIY